MFENTSLILTFITAFIIGILIGRLIFKSKGGESGEHKFM